MAWSDLRFLSSLDSISKNFGPVRVDVLGKIAEAVLGGLRYLYLAHKIMHRDIKPSNILVNSKGQIKLCDFGVSSELVNSVADTFVGTGTYMAPERIQGSPYTVKSDVWSVGLTLMELAIGKFPFSVENDDDEEGAGGPQGILDLLQQIVLEPAPKLPKSEAFPQILEDVIAKCLAKDPAERPTPAELWEHDPFLQAAKRTPVNLEEWAVSMMERHNRKSHLAPQLSPGSKALLRGQESGAKEGQAPPPASASAQQSSSQSQSQSQGSTSLPPSARSDRSHFTPTSGEIPISSAPNGAMQQPQQAQPRPFPTRTSSAQQVSSSSQQPSYDRQHERLPQGYEKSREYSGGPGYDRGGGGVGYGGQHGGGQFNLPMRGPPPGGRMPQQQQRPETAGAGGGREDRYGRQKPGYVQ